MLSGFKLKTTLALALLVYLLTLVWTLPAAFVWKHMAGQLPVQVSLQGLSGTLWSGQIGRIEVEGIDQGALSWRWRPGQLFSGRVALELLWQPRNGRVDAQLKLGLGSLVLEQVRGQLDAGSMAAVNRAPFVLGGSWLLDVPRLVLNDFEFVTEADGRLVWQDAAGGLPQVMPFGHLRADLHAEDGWLVMTLADQDGPLGLQGTAQWRPGQAMAIDTRLQARSDADPGLAAGLGMLGRADADGWVRWRVQVQ